MFSLQIVLVIIVYILVNSWRYVVFFSMPTGSQGDYVSLHRGSTFYFKGNTMFVDSKELCKLHYVRSMSLIE